MSDAIIDILKRFDTPTVCNVIELCGCRPNTSGTLNHRITSRYPDLPPMVGYAVTATFRSAQPASPDEQAVKLFESKPQFDRVAGPRVVVVQDLDDPQGGAVYGEIMVRLFKTLGCAGLVTDGFGRDIAQVGALDFPCFTAGISATHANGRILTINEPVTVGGVTVRPGDLIHGDANGVTTVPLDFAEKIACCCEPYVQAEEELMGHLTPDTLACNGMGSHLTDFGDRLQRLRQEMQGTGTKPVPEGLV